MDTSLEQILENYFSTENSFAKHLSIKIIQNLNFDEKPSNEYLIDVNQFSFQLLLLTSHFLSQAASTYHLPIAYLDLSNSTESDFENTLKSISLRIPTSIRVVAGRLKNDQITFKQFEKKSTHNLNKKSNFDEDSFNKFGAIVVNVNNEPTIALQVLLEKFFASNMAVFYILLVCPFDVSFNDFKIKGDNSTKIYRHQGLKSSIVLITNVKADSYQNLFQFEIDKLNSNDIFNTLRLSNPLKPLKADDFPNSKQIRKIPGEQVKSSRPNMVSFNNYNFWLTEAEQIKLLSPDEYLYELKNVFISGDGYVWMGEHVVEESLAYINPKAATVPTNFATKLVGHFFLIQTTLPHHSHFFQESLKNLSIIEELKSHNINLLASDKLTQSQREFLEIMGYENTKYKSFHETYFVESLLLCVSELHYSNLSLDYFRKIYLKNYSSDSQKSKLYVSRQDAKSYRNLINEPEVEQIFMSFGFEIIRASELSAKDKVRVFGNASVIAGPAGAAFHYATFSENASLIILTHDKYYLNYIEPIKFFKNSDIVYIVGIRLAQWHPVQGNSHDSFYIHPEYLRQIMTKIDLVF